LVLVLAAGVLLGACQPTVTALPSAPAWNGDAPDPHITRFGSTWYAYTTGTTWGNHIGVLVSDRPDGGWRTTTGKSYGSSALPKPPSWQVTDTQWAPAVYRFAGRYVMFYAAQRASTREFCISVATASSPAGPFTDTSAGPTICQDHLGGVIDPHPFVDADGTPWLHFKTNDGEPNASGWGTHLVSTVLATRLAADGATPKGSFVEVLRKDTQRFPWQTTVDNPQMVLRDGTFYLFHSGGDYVGNGSYVTGYATCDGPTGPCRTAAEPILRSYGTVAGPGGGTVASGADGRWWLSYHAWPKGCYSYACGTRRMYVAPLEFR
jgi:beta-xylosidase